MFYRYGKGWLAAVILSAMSSKNLSAAIFDLVTPQEKVTIVYAPGDPTLDSIAASLLAGDIERVTGYRPRVTDNIDEVLGNVILIGTVRSALMNSLDDPGGRKGLEGKWECYQLKVFSHPFKNIKDLLAITGSDSRGTAYGVFDLSQRIGVSPWYWWADAHPVIRRQLSINIDNFISEPPSVKYRGIFINDEDWGLQPWAARTLEPATGDIGPATYARVFELLLRLKANLIWPAMHPCTKAFYHYPENEKVAADYQIVVGSSHAEPMLRNNVSEWDKSVRGDFNYITNRRQVLTYWEERVKESRHNNAIYTLGMRGIHDSGIEGVKSNSEAVPLLEQIISDQRGLLEKYIDSSVTKVPQAFTAYKEVLDIYDSHLRLPGDVTLVWPDDNYGYIQRLDDSVESRREGGSGIYYHASYWGRPHDYLWLSTTHPALIREEMTKAYDMNARNIWVLNVGDIKPAEYNIQLFMDMAFHIAPFKNSSYTKVHLTRWLASIFGKPSAAAMADILWEYYQLAFERKPEFMGWSQTEPTTPVNPTAYNHEYYGDQARRRLGRYAGLEHGVKQLALQVPGAAKDAFYELLYYPVVCASLMNKKFLYRDKALLDAKEGRLSAGYYAGLSREAYAGIVKETKFYNEQLAAGKWAGIMSMHPRDLPVFQEPGLPLPRTGVPAADKGDDNGRISGPGNKVSGPDNKVTGLDKRFGVRAARGKVPKGYKGFVETDGYISIYASHYQKLTSAGVDHWEEIDGLGATGRSLEALPLRFQPLEGTVNTPAGGGLPGVMADEPDLRKRPSVEYDFYTFRPGPVECKIYTLPTSPLNKNFGMRYAVSVDDSIGAILDFKTVGRSEEWKQDVLSNSAVRSVKWPSLRSGPHRLKIYMIDPGVILDRIVIDLGGLRPFYGVLPESGRR
jgi:hypothetical protein